MSKVKGIPLKIEMFSAGDDSKFRTYSKREILSVLKGIIQEGGRAVLYYDDGDDFIPTLLLDADEQGMWLDVGAMEACNQRILRSNKVIFISSLRKVKVQFVADHVEDVLYEEGAAFYIPLPDSLLRIQRREYFRLTTPASNPLKCIIHPPEEVLHTPAVKREAIVMDISVGGVALVCEAEDTDLQPGKTYPDCQITLPDVGVITATIQVKNTFEVTLHNGQISRRAGCEFLRLSGEASTLLQRYITRLQSESLVSQQTLA